MSHKASLPNFWILSSSTLAITVVVAAITAIQFYRAREKVPKRDHDDIFPPSTSLSSSSYMDLVGKTPMVRLHCLSTLINRHIWVKMESLNPSGTGKDRAAVGMILAAEAEGFLPPPVLLHNSSTHNNYEESHGTTHPSHESPNSPDALLSNDTIDASLQQALSRSRSGGIVIEGTSGSTGIALATFCHCRGHACLFVLPDDQAAEKRTILLALRATVYVVPTAAIANPRHYVNVARRIAQRAQEQHLPAFFTNQFDNAANFAAQYRHTGPELLQQCPDLTAFVMSCGTGGTLAGVSRFLKEQTQCRTVLVDPPGSALYHKIQHGVIYAAEQRERVLKRHRYDTIAEGIGLDRLTLNLQLGLDYIDTAVQVSDQEALDMAHWLLCHEGLWVGSSSAMNVVGAVRTALDLPAGSKVVTMVCDSGVRHVTRFWNREFCCSRGLQWPADQTVSEQLPECLRQVDVVDARPEANGTIK